MKIEQYSANQNVANADFTPAVGLIRTAEYDIATLPEETDVKYANVLFVHDASLPTANIKYYLSWDIVCVRGSSDEVVVSSGITWANNRTFLNTNIFGFYTVSNYHYETPKNSLLRLKLKRKQWLGAFNPIIARVRWAKLWK